MSALIIRPNAYYIALLQLPHAFIGHWFADDQGLHLTHSSEKLDVTHLVPPDALAVVHPTLYPALRIMSEDGPRAIGYLYAQMRYLLDPTSLPDCTGTTHWLYLLKEISWEVTRDVVAVTAWAYEVSSVDIPFITNVRPTAFAAPTSAFDTQAPGWRDRFLIAQTLGLHGTECVRYICEPSPGVTPLTLPALE